MTSASANGDTPQPISINNILGVTPPIAGATPVESITPTAQYTGSIAWSDLDGPLVGNFQPSTIYKATITLSAAPGYTYGALTNDFFDIEGATNVLFSNDIGEITAIFDPVFSDGAEKLDRSFATNGTFKFSDVFGSTPLNENNSAVGRVEVDRIAVDSQDRVIVLGSFYSDSAERVEIGSGFRNSLAIAAQIGNESATSAAVAALAHRGGGKSDWYLPSILELGEMYSEGVIVGGLSTDAWSSTEDSISYARIFGVSGPEETLVAQKSELKAVRPIRAGTLATPEIGDSGPGGGTIFYETTTAFACGPTLSTTCNYLEAAPSDWTGSQGDPVMSWSTDENQITEVIIDHHILFRLNEDGSHDNTFGNPATTLRKDSNDIPKRYVLITTTGAFYSETVDLEIASDDKILVMLSGSIPGSYLGNYHNFVARYKSDGMIDENFGNAGAIGSLAPQEGPALSLFTDFTLDTNNHILAVSLATLAPIDMVIEKFLPNGLLDESFGDSNTGESVVPIGYPYPESPTLHRKIQIMADGDSGYVIAFTGFFCTASQENPCPEELFFTQLLRLDQDGVLDVEFIIDATFQDAPPNLIQGFALTDMFRDGESGFILSGTTQNPMDSEEIFGLVIRIKLTGETDLVFAGSQNDYRLNPIASNNCTNSALNGPNSADQSDISEIFVGEYCWDDSDAPPALRVKTFLPSGEFQGGVTLPETLLTDYPLSISQMVRTTNGKLLFLTGAQPFAGYWGLINQRYFPETAWSEVEISRFQLIDIPAPAPEPPPAPVFISTPPLTPYLKTLTAPKIHLMNEKVTCSAGTYNAGFVSSGVNQGSPTSLFTASGFTFKIFIDGVSQESLTVISESATASWQMPKAPTGALISCSVTVSFNGITNSDKSTDNNAGVVAAIDAQVSAKTRAQIYYLESLTAISKAYEITLSDNRLTWQSSTEKKRREYQAKIAKIKSSPSTKTTRASSARALSNFRASRTKILANYKARNQAALAAKEFANRQALLSRDAALAKASATYSAFIESIGHGVLIP